MRLLVLDNYDSFTYNLVQYVQEILGQKVDVRRNDAITLAEVDAYSHIILSPGPGVPKDAGIMPALIERYAATKKILGVCLGHQAIAEAFGSPIYNLPQVHHGVAATLTVTDPEEVLFKNLPTQFAVGRYHSWSVRPEQLSDALTVTATTPDGIMALRHRDYDVRGVQFHPESVLTEHGMAMLRNWLDRAVADC